MNLQQDMNDQENLPDFMKDFHDQKDVFKTIFEPYKNCKYNSELLSEIGWINAHRYTIDVFLWWMGLHGYKLQKSRKKDIEFANPSETIEYYRKIRNERMSQELNNAISEFSANK